MSELASERNDTAPAGTRPTSASEENRVTDVQKVSDKLAADPVLVEIVAGTLAAIEMEVETSIGRTSRSPMIRDAHDFRAGIHDRQLRKLTGLSLIHI